MKSGRRADSTEPRAQYAALPWRRAETIEVMLVSSRETRRWVLPKGWPMKGRKPHDAAAQEALEEAGIEGKIAKSPVGTYRYIKRMKNGSAQPCQVTVFPFEVLREHMSWPEQHERIRRWFAANEAADAVDEPDLAEVIRAFAPAADKKSKTGKRSSSTKSI
jgi:8-oxo-dGTP pyrophosphatase MutT (NUDIX family)